MEPLQARKNSESEFARLPLPGAKDENYRYFPWQDLLVLKSESQQPLEEKISFLGLQTDETACAEITASGSLFSGAFAQGHFLDLNAALAQKQSAALSALPIPDKFQSDKFAQVASARWTQGAFLRFNPGTESPKAVRVSMHADSTTNVWRNILQMEAGSKGTYIHELTVGAGAGECIDLSTIDLAEHSHLHWMLFVRANEKSRVVQRLHVNLAAHSQLKVTPVFLGAGALQCRLTVNLQGVGAQLDLQAAVRAQNQEVCDFWFEADHSASDTKSTAEYYSVVDDSARTVFNGLIQVRKNTLHCEAIQRSKALLLSDRAQSLAHPKLLIQTDEVQCAHGASVSSVNPDQLYYLESRGIPRPEASRMIVQGFTAPVLQRISVESLSHRVDGFLNEKKWKVEQ